MVILPAVLTVKEITDKALSNCQEGDIFTRLKLWFRIGNKFAHKGCFGLIATRGHSLLTVPSKQNKVQFSQVCHNLLHHMGQYRLPDTIL